MPDKKGYEQRARETLPERVQRDSPECHRLIVDTTDVRILFMAKAMDEVIAMPTDTTQQRIAKASYFLSAVERACHGPEVLFPDMAEWGKR